MRLGLEAEEAGGEGSYVHGEEISEGLAGEHLDFRDFAKEIEDLYEGENNENGENGEEEPAEDLEIQEKIN